ncbi:MAG: Na+/H+ antiporter NhaA [Thermoflavifilum sp.]|nr:Na+/H+ antiporter NhaA [Thermoflavifilum sp.]
MWNFLFSNSANRISNYLTRIFQDFIKSSKSVGIVLLICTIVSLIIANSSWSDVYHQIWHYHISINIPMFKLPHSIMHWINDGFMVIFFLLVGIEIKRELWEGELASFRRSILPIGAAIGGMLVPAGIYLLFNVHAPYRHGWGIPMATDIAFSLGILFLLGDRVPNSLKIFLSALAIIDDLGAILVIAIFYSSQIHLLYLVLALLMILIMIVMNLLRVRRVMIYILPMLILWISMFNSGVHATVAGVLAAFCLPLSSIEKLEHVLHLPVNFIVLPLFALANTDLFIPANVGTAIFSTLGWGVMLGLILGKPAGILLSSYLLVKTGVAHLPAAVRWKHILGIGMLAGIGFTMSIFITTLAFDVDEWQLTAKLAVLLGSLISGVLGFAYLKWFASKAS